MKHIAFLLFIIASFALNAQRQYNIITDTITGKYTLRIDEVVSDGVTVRGGYTATEYGDTAAVTAAIIARRNNFIEAALQAEAQLAALRAERDSLSALLNNWWAFGGGSMASRSVLAPPLMPPPAAHELKKKSKAIPPKKPTKKQ